MKDANRGAAPGSAGVALSLPVRIDLGQRVVYQLEALTLELASLCKRKTEVPTDSVLALAVVGRVAELVSMLSVLMDVTCDDMTAVEIDADLSQWGEPEEFHPLPLHEIDPHYARRLTGGWLNL